MNKIAIITLAAAITILPATTGVLAVSNPDEPIFSDVQTGNKYYTSIKYLKDQGLIEGYSDGSFKPYNEINRAEAIKVLLKALPETQDQTTPIETEIPNPKTFYFPDITPTDWFFEDLVIAWNNKLITGYNDGLFHPENTINRAESLKIALLKEGTQIPDQITDPPYTDVPADAWFAKYAQIAKERTIFLENRGDGSLNPSNPMNRGDFIEMIYRIIKSQEGSTFARTTWYGDEGVNWGTASGEKFNANAMTAAHKTLPFGTIIRVTNTNNGAQVDVTINDRGPYPTGVDLDLTKGAFSAIASTGAGIINTEFQIITQENTNTQTTNSTIPQYGF